MRKLTILCLMCVATLAAQYTPSGKPMCSASVTTNCVPNADASGNVAVGPTLPGAVLGGTVGAWNRYTVTYTDAAFKTIALAVSIVLGQLPAEGVIEAVRLKHSAAFAGAGVASFTCSLGDGVAHTAYATNFNVFQAASATAQLWSGGAYSATAAAHDLTLRCTANVNMGNGAATVLTAGSLSVWIKTAVLQ